MDVTLLRGGIFHGEKGTTFNTYSNEIKLSAVQSYLNGEGSYDMIAKKYQIRSSTQLKNWVKNIKNVVKLQILGKIIKRKVYRTL